MVLLTLFCNILDTYDQGQKDVQSEDNMEMSDEEESEPRTDDRLLPPEVFKHIDSPEQDKDKTVSAPLTGIVSLILIDSLQYLIQDCVSPTTIRER